MAVRDLARSRRAEPLGGAAPSWRLLTRSFPGKVVEVHDGDTVVFDLDLGFGFRLPGKSWSGKTELSCRVLGINAPELATVEGKAAATYARMLLIPGDICLVVSHGWDKYGGRFDGSITLADGRDFATEMLRSGNATPYAG